MAPEERKKNRDGTTLSSDEYVALVLAVVVPLIGLLFGVYMKTQHNPFGNRVITISLIAAVVWIVLVLAI